MDCQLSFLDQAPKRLQDITMQDWDWRHHTLARQLYQEAPLCICWLWWWGILAEMRGHKRAYKRIRAMLARDN